MKHANIQLSFLEKPNIERGKDKKDEINSDMFWETYTFEQQAYITITFGIEKNP